MPGKLNIRIIIGKILITKTLSENVVKEKVLESISEKERIGTYRHDKNTFPILVNLVMR